MIQKAAKHKRERQRHQPLLHNRTTVPIGVDHALECDVSLIQIHLIAECGLTLHGPQIGLELDAELNGRGRLMVVEQVE